jgi:hypothetical protein
MKLILHIGTEKTGSSTIQHVLKKNQKTLLDNGYFFINSTRFGLKKPGRHGGVIVFNRIEGWCNA